MLQKIKLFADCLDYIFLLYQDNQTPLHVAVRTNYLPIVELLLNAGSDPNIMTKDNYTPLHMAIKEDSEDIVRILIEHDANPEVKTKVSQCCLFIS